MVSLDEVEHFSDNQKASVATLRWCSASARNTVRLPFGKRVRLRRNPQAYQIACLYGEGFLAITALLTIEVPLQLREPQGPRPPMAAIAPRSFVATASSA